MERGFARAEIDTSRPHPARMYNYYLGGQDNYPADREAAEAVLRIAPEGRLIARENRAFLQRAVRFLAGEAGIGQFLDVGTGIPAAGNVHEIAQQVNPAARVAYADNDPIVAKHADALLTGSGTTGFVLADLRDPQSILSHPQVRDLIDFTQPAGLLLVAVLHFLTEADDPARSIAALRDALAPGSYLVLSHATSDFHPPAMVSAGTAVYNRATAPMVPRTHAQILRLFDGFDLLEPGLVQAPLWRPDREPPEDLHKVAIYGGVGRKPAPPVSAAAHRH